MRQHRTSGRCQAGGACVRGVGGGAHSAAEMCLTILPRWWLAPQFALAGDGAGWVVRLTNTDGEDVEVGTLSPASLSRMRFLFYAAAGRGGSATPPSPDAFKLWACHVVARYVASREVSLRACVACGCAGPRRHPLTRRSVMGCRVGVEVVDVLSNTLPLSF